MFGTETRGVDIPYVTPDYETNIKGVFIVGELGGMGLIKNAITQGIRAVERIAAEPRVKALPDGVLDLIIVGAGPVGIGASLTAAKNKLKFATIEQDDIGGAVLQYPRNKIVMTSSVDLPLYGKVKLKETTKEALLGLWMEVVGKTGIKINTHEKMTGLQKEDGWFRVRTTKAEYLAERVVLAIGRRGTPRKLGVPGENLPKVAYKLLDPQQHTDADLPRGRRRRQRHGGGHGPLLPAGQQGNAFLQGRVIRQNQAVEQGQARKSAVRQIAECHALLECEGDTGKGGRH